MAALAERRLKTLITAEEFWARVRIAAYFVWKNMEITRRRQNWEDAHAQIRRERRIGSWLLKDQEVRSCAEAIHNSRKEADSLKDWCDAELVIGEQYEIG